jgi:hypothetical protein
VEDHTPRREHVFVVRIWREAGVSRDANWRGFVDDVDGNRLYVTGFADLNDFFRIRLGMRPPEASTGDFR